MRPWTRRALKILGGALLALALLVGGVFVAFRHAMPNTASGDANPLARRMLAAVDADAWARTGAVRWTAPNGARHIWDRQRNYHRYEHKGLMVQLDLGLIEGVAWRGGRRLTGREAEEALDLGYARFCNDSFWLNPVPKAFDNGTARSLAHDVNGRDGVLVSYATGGVTPGDRYLWILDANARPTAWRMWVSILPIPGLEASWEGWTRLPTGAWISTLHRVGPVTLRITNLRAAESLAALMPGVEPFHELIHR